MFTRPARLCLAAGAALLTGSVLTTPAVAGASTHPAGTFGGTHRTVPRNAAGHGLPRVAEQATGQLPAGVPASGRYAFLLRLGTESTLGTYRNAVPRGRAVAGAAARTQFARIKAAQSDVVAALPRDTRVLYTTHSVLAGVAVVTDVRDYGALQRIPGVQAVYPIAPKTVSNSYAVPLVHGPQAWAAHGDLGQNSTIAVIDTGIDYTHADFGGPGTAAAYQTARAHDTDDPAYPDPAKIVGGHDFAGDDYNADPTDPAYQPVPHPDNNPLDCAGHGSHVAGIAAGYGVTTAGATFAGDYLSLGSLSTSDYQNTFRIGPGMAPKAKLLAYKVFGCAGSTDLVGEAIDAAADPNGDGDPSDHADVINMSLGSDYGAPDDGDAVESNFASQLGITVVVASGNGGDYYDVGGSPGDAVRTIAVANSVDAYSQIDSLHITLDGAPQVFGAQRSAAYDWATKPDLSGTVVKLSDPSNLDGCTALDAADATAVSGKIAFLEWTDNDAQRRCGSAARSRNVAAAGAVGAILGEDEETFAAGISGSATIPVVQVVKSAADAIRASLSDNEPNSVTGTSAADYTQLLPSQNDRVNPSSSRGTHAAGDLKPDVTAVGTSVFSTAMGTGDQGVSFTGTSMATPMVAGLAALVRSMHREWTPEEVKADIMNTAGQDLYVGADHTGTRYAPNRVGAGRIEADAALDNLVLAYDQNDPGAVSASFGPVAFTGPRTLTKTIKVVNKSLNAASFTVSYQAITSVPGVSYSVSPTSITLGRAATTTVTLSLKVTNAALLTKTRDATLARTVDVGNGVQVPREFLADASGRVAFTPAGGYTGPALRVPVYSAPRPASTMTQAGTLDLPGSGVQLSTLHLTGHGLAQGSGSAKVVSAVAGLELDATSGTAPNCSATVITLCVHEPSEHSADLKYVGTSSDAPFRPSPIKQAEEFFSVTTQRPWTTPVGPQEFDILIDTNNDGKPDAILYNTRYRAADIFLSELVDVTNSDPTKWCIRDDELINDRLGDTDTALFDSDTMVLPMAVAALGPVHTDCGAGPVTLPALPGFSNTHTRIHFGVVTFGESGVVDAIGVDRSTVSARRPTLAAPLSTDVLHPGVTLFGPVPPTTFPNTTLIWKDTPGDSVTLARDVRAYNADRALGALVIHFHNAVGWKAQRLALKSVPKVTEKLSATKVRLHRSITVTVTVSDTAGHLPTGKVDLRRVRGRIIRSGDLSHGTIRFTFTTGSRGSFQVRAEYHGDANYAAGRSAALTVRVT